MSTGARASGAKQLLSWLPWPVLISLTAIVIVWHVGAMLLGNTEILPEPAAVGAALREMLGGELPGAVGETLGRLVRGFGVGATLGFALAMLAVSARPAEVLIDPLVELLRPVSGLAWYPLAVMLFGVTDFVALFLVTYVATFPVFINTVAGIKGVDQRLVHAAAVLGASPTRIALRVVLPAAMPMVLAGLRLSLGVSWMTLIAAEVLGADYVGMGELIFAYERDFLQANVLATIFAIGVIGYLVDSIVRLVQTWLTRWQADAGAG